MQDLEQKIREIEERNQRVETNKAWETSWTRRLLLTAFTYLTIGVYLWTIEIQRPWLNAIVPAVAFMISTLIMPFFKKLWLRNRNVEDNVEDAPPQSLLQGKSRELIEEKENFKKENLEKLRGYIKGKKRISNNEAEEVLNISNATAERYLDDLEKEGMLKQVGRTGRSVFYEVK